MNKAQWNVLGIALLILGPILLLGASAISCSPVSMEADLLTACYVRRYSFSVPGLISIALGIAFLVCAAFEARKK
jgi:hypothetical protein